MSEFDGYRGGYRAPIWRNTPAVRAALKKHLREEVRAIRETEAAHKRILKESKP